MRATGAMDMGFFIMGMLGVNDRLGILSIHPSMGDDRIKGLAEGDLLLDAGECTVLLEFLEEFLRGHLVALGHRGDAPGKFLPGDADPLLPDHLAQDKVQLHLVTGALARGTEQLFLMGTEFLLGDAALLVLADDLLEDRGALLLDHRGGDVDRHHGEKLLHDIGTDLTGEILYGVGLQPLTDLLADLLKRRSGAQLGGKGIVKRRKFALLDLVEGHLVDHLVAAKLLLAELVGEGDRAITCLARLHAGHGCGESRDRALLLQLDPEVLAACIGRLQVGIGLGNVEDGTSVASQ